jgi:fatty-acyl-CoA synthase
VRWELDWLETRASMTPDAAAIGEAESDQVWTFKEVNARAKAIAVLSETGTTQC